MPHMKRIIPSKQTNHFNQGCFFFLSSEILTYNVKGKRVAGQNWAENKILQNFLKLWGHINKRQSAKFIFLVPPHGCQFHLISHSRAAYYLIRGLPRQEAKICLILKPPQRWWEEEPWCVGTVQQRRGERGRRSGQRIYDHWFCCKAIYIILLL